MNYILPKDGNFYKTNLHSHSTDSDGHLSARELRDMYKAHGYSVLCVTDHDRFIDRQHLNEDDFLMLNGLELSIGQFGREGRLVHIGMIATSPDIKPRVLFTCPDRDSLSDEEYTKAVNDAVKIASL